jgi:hypothetical protein
MEIKQNKYQLKARKRLVKLIRRLLLRNTILSPQALLEAEIQCEATARRNLKAIGGIALICTGAILWMHLPWGIWVALPTIPAGIFLIVSAIIGEKKKVKVYLSDLVDAPGLGIDIAEVVTKVFQEVKPKFRKDVVEFGGGGGEFGGGGADNTWETEMPDPNSDISISVDSISLPDITEGAEQLASGILEGIFSGL